MIVAIAAMLACSSGAQVPAPRDLVRRADATAVEVDASALVLPEGAIPEADGRRILSVAREGASRPVAGRYTRDGDRLRFTPVAPLVAGDTYTIELRLDGGDPVVRTLAIPPAEVVPPEVRAVYPSAERLPANQLKFTVRFSTPMRDRRDGMRAFGLYDVEVGAEVPLALRDQPLWNAERDAVTVLVHPGRVKTDIPFAADLGPVLAEGRTYELRLDGGMESASGGELEAAVLKRFSVGPADREGPDPARWTLVAPVAVGGALQIHFDEPVDEATVRTAFRVARANGSAVEGRFELSDRERELRFSPQAPWEAGAYALETIGRVEDLAGNTPDRPFDAPGGEKARATVPTSFPFEVGG